MSTYFVLLGAPGAGKGTQAKRLVGELGVQHISSGDIFRENINNQTELGNLAQGYIARGALVPDDVTIAMIGERLRRPDCIAGAVLDGFPRTTAQAEALDGILAQLGGKVDAVLYIRVPKDVLIRRLSGRWMCRAQGHIYHEDYNPPQTPGVCDYDQSPLYQRDDDKVETVAQRIEVYLEETAPLIKYYQKLGLLVEVDGDQPIEAVTHELMAIITQKVLS
jgi:adenylate kinase